MNIVSISPHSTQFYLDCDLITTHLVAILRQLPHHPLCTVDSRYLLTLTNKTVAVIHGQCPGVIPGQLCKLLQLALITKTTQPTKKWAPGKPTTAYHQKPAKLPPQTEKLSSRPSTTSQAQRSRGGDDRKLWRIIINSIMVAKAQKLPCIKI